MRSCRGLLPIIVFLTLLSCAQLRAEPSPPTGGWLHAEMGAANYARAGEFNFEAFKVFLSRYVQINGPRGTVIINDISGSGAEICLREMELFARQQGWHDMHFEVRLGDMFTIPLPENLSTVHIQNPGVSTLTARSSPQLDELVARIQELARRARHGILITSYFHEEMNRIRDVGRLTAIRMGESDVYYRAANGEPIRTYPTQYWVPPRRLTDSPEVTTFPLGRVGPSANPLLRCPLELFSPPE